MIELSIEMFVLSMEKWSAPLHLSQSVFVNGIVEV